MRTTRLKSSRYAPPTNADVDSNNPQTDEEEDEEQWLLEQCQPISYPNSFSVSSQDAPLIYIFTSPRHAKLVIYQCQQHLKQCKTWLEITRASLSVAKAQADPAMQSRHEVEIRLLLQMSRRIAQQCKIALNPGAFTIPGQEDADYVTGLPIAGPHFITLAGAQTR